jgi:Flp pilus assembly protein TadG
MRGGLTKHRTLAARLRRLIGDRSGGVAVYVALTATITFGIVGLAIDATRALIVRSESQTAADAAALVAASQLDGTPSAITRANAALAGLVTNNQNFASTGAGAVGIAGVRFLSALPADDNLPITDDFVTTDPLEARFVEVTTAPLTHLNTFLRAIGAVDAITITTRSVGGCRQMLCRTLPMMICNPAEANEIGAPFDIDLWFGRQVRLLHQGGPNAPWAPGNFGYLAAGGTGTNDLRDALASVSGGNVCYGPGATTEPGAKSGARAALNVRFGIYQNPGFGGGASNDPEFAPDVNVRAMPRDALFTGPDLRFGDGHWDCLTYWNANFAGAGVARPADCTADTVGYTRYDMYRFESDNGLIDEPGPGGVTGIPPENAANALPDRRIIYVAVVNCRDIGLSGRQTVPVVSFIRVFLTEPVSEPSGVEIIGEIIDVVQVGVDEAVLREIVQLYR